VPLIRQLLWFSSCGVLYQCLSNHTIEISKDAHHTWNYRKYPDIFCRYDWIVLIENAREPTMDHDCEWRDDRDYAVPRICHRWGAGSSRGRARSRRCQFRIQWSLAFRGCGQHAHACPAAHDGPLSHLWHRLDQFRPDCPPHEASGPGPMPGRCSDDFRENGFCILDSFVSDSIQLVANDRMQLSSIPNDRNRHRHSVRDDSSFGSSLCHQISSRPRRTAIVTA
jgi:hypothetical protein